MHLVFIASPLPWSAQPVLCSVPPVLCNASPFCEHRQSHQLPHQSYQMHHQSYQMKNSSMCTGSPSRCTAVLCEPPITPVEMQSYPVVSDASRVLSDKTPFRVHPPTPSHTNTSLVMYQITLAASILVIIDRWCLGNSAERSGTPENHVVDTMNHIK